MNDPSVTQSAYCSAEHACRTCKALWSGEDKNDALRHMRREMTPFMGWMGNFQLIDGSAEGQTLAFELRSPAAVERVTFRFDHADGGCYLFVRNELEPTLWIGKVFKAMIPGDGRSVTQYLERYLALLADLAECTYGRTVPGGSARNERTPETGAAALRSVLCEMAYDLCRGYAVVVCCRPALSPIELAAARFALSQAVYTCWFALGWTSNRDRLESVVRRVVLPELRERGVDVDAVAEFVSNSMPFYMWWADTLLPFGKRDAVSALTEIRMLGPEQRPQRALELLTPLVDAASERWRGHLTRQQAAEFVADLIHHD